MQLLGIEFPRIEKYNQIFHLFFYWRQIRRNENHLELILKSFYNVVNLTGIHIQLFIMLLNYKNLTLSLFYKSIPFLGHL